MVWLRSIQEHSLGSQQFNQLLLVPVPIRHKLAQSIRQFNSLTKTILGRRYFPSVAPTIPQSKTKTEIPPRRLKTWVVATLTDHTNSAAHQPARRSEAHIHNHYQKHGRPVRWVHGRPLQRKTPCYPSCILMKEGVSPGLRRSSEARFTPSLRLTLLFPRGTCVVERIHRVRI